MSDLVRILVIHVDHVVWLGANLNHTLVALASRLIGRLVLSLCHFLLGLDSLLVNAVTDGLSTAAEDGEGIKPGVGAEDLAPIFSCTDIVH